VDEPEPDEPEEPGEVADDEVVELDEDGATGPVEVDALDVPAAVGVGLGDRVVPADGVPRSPAM